MCGDSEQGRLRDSVFNKCVSTLAQKKYFSVFCWQSHPEATFQEVTVKPSVVSISNTSVWRPLNPQSQRQEIELWPREIACDAYGKLLLVKFFLGSLCHKLELNWTVAAATYPWSNVWSWTTWLKWPALARAEDSVSAITHTLKATTHGTIFGVLDSRLALTQIGVRH